MGAILMRGAGCTINDLWDKSYDKRVSRTKSRPLASDQLLNSDAVFFLAGQLGASVLILSTFDLNSMIIGASSMILVSTYPAFKRFTNWPQLVLGATFNWGVLLGSSVATAGDLSFIPMILPLYAAGICWTVVYDTIYAHQDKIDDSLIGLKSTALTFGKNTKTWLSLFSAGMVSNLLLTGYLTDQMWPFYAAVAATGLHFAFQIRELNIDDVDNCWKLFKRNSQVGVILLIGIILSTLIKDKQKPSDTIVNNNKSV
jgi:4-hydroxybenzoate polyprenyltransferase